jgi:hypothetical protein
MKKMKVRVKAIFLAFMAVVLLVPVMTMAGSLEPIAPPAPTMHTLDEIYQKLDAVANQQIPLPTGFVLYSDNPRFAVWDPNTPSDPTDDLVLDRSTGLIWTRNANLPNGTKSWQDAVTYCQNLEFPSNNNREDWRLPSIEELTTLTEPYPSTHHPALPIPNPFVNVQSGWYWSSTEYAGNPVSAWLVYLYTGYLYDNGKSLYIYVWPVRGGK